jgi:hypothetical protein
MIDGTGGAVLLAEWEGCDVEEAVAVLAIRDCSKGQC